MEAFITTNLVPHMDIWWLLSDWSTTPHIILPLIKITSELISIDFWFVVFRGFKINPVPVRSFLPKDFIVNVSAVEIVKHSTIDYGRFFVIGWFSYQSLKLCMFVGLCLAIRIGIIHRADSVSFLWAIMAWQRCPGNCIVTGRTHFKKMAYTRAHMTIKVILSVVSFDIFCDDLLKKPLSEELVVAVVAVMGEEIMSPVRFRQQSCLQRIHSLAVQNCLIVEKALRQL